MRPVEIVRKLCPHARHNYVAAFEQGDALFARAEIDTKLRMIHFLARAFQETGDLTIEWESGLYKTAQRLFDVFGVGHHSARITFQEAQSLVALPPDQRERAIFERVYGLGNPDKARELGNTRPGDGYRYRGGGILQTTGGANYRRMGDKTGVNFYDNPELIVSADHALKPALAEWTESRLNVYADQDDALAVGRGINLGNPKSTRIPNGFGDQQNWLRILRGTVDRVDLTLDPQQTASPGPTIVRRDATWLQRTLNELGYGPLSEDGRVGPATRASVRKFQNDHGLVIDGIAGPRTNAAIEQAILRKV